MKNINYLYDTNKGVIKIPLLVKKKFLNYNSNIKYFDFFELRKLINFFYSVEKKYGNLKFLNYKIDYLNEFVFADKLTYILLECLLYYLIMVKGKKIDFNIHNYKKTIFTEGFHYSSIKYIYDKEKFTKNFCNSISNFHFRKVVEYKEKKLDDVSFLLADLSQFLITCGISDEQSREAAEISVELIDNALEHSKSDCLIDIDVSKNPYYKDGDKSKEFFAVNIAVVDFSDSILGKEIELVANSKNIENEHYQKLKKIKKLHEKFFSKLYTKDNFYMMSAFQNKISSRNDSGLTGGKGLTKLIQELQESSVSDICYVVSDDMCLFFIKDHIKQDEQKWVGFNEENNCELSPHKNAFGITPLRIMGTGYNLTFVFEKE